MAPCEYPASAPRVRARTVVHELRDACATAQPSEYLADEHLWVWLYEGNQMFMDVGEPVRCHVPARVPGEYPASTGMSTP